MYGLFCDKRQKYRIIIKKIRQKMKNKNTDRLVGRWARELLIKPLFYRQGAGIRT